MNKIQYYLVVNRTHVGPFSFDELKSQNLEPNTLVWFDGLDKWHRAKDIPELISLLAKMPPPIDQIEDEHIHHIPPIPDFSKIVFQNKSNDFELASIGQRFLGYVIFNIIIFALVYYLGDNSNDTTSDSFLMSVIYAGIGTGIINGIFYPFFSGNLAHMILGLKVIKISDGSDVKSLWEGYQREFFKGALTIFILPIIWLVFNEKRQNLYDLIKGTIVVKNKVRVKF